MKNEVSFPRRRLSCSCRACARSASHGGMNRAHGSLAFTTSVCRVPNLVSEAADEVWSLSTRYDMDFLRIEEDGRTFTCRSASSPATPGTSWWWLELPGESQRYAAFRTEPGDTPENLRPRVLAWHAQLLLDRARPPQIRPRWGRPAAPKPAESEGDEGQTATAAQPAQ
jgi:hypothetical protein